MSAVNSLVKSIKHRFDHEAAKKLLKEKYEAKLLFAQDGGMWNAGPELICVLSNYDTEEIFLVDTYKNPCKVNREKLLTEAKQRYQEQLNQWEAELQSISRKR